MSYNGAKYKSIKSTCKGCKNRYPGCHDRCEDFQDALSEWNEFKRKIETKKKREQDYESFRIEGLRRVNK